jgi:FtsZ-interacting cell division protein ZipA
MEKEIINKNIVNKIEEIKDRTLGIDGVNKFHPAKSEENNKSDEKKIKKEGEKITNARNTSTRPAVVPGLGTTAVRKANAKTVTYEIIPKECNGGDLIVLFLKAEKNSLFKGEDIKSLLIKHGLKAGDRKIWHLYRSEEGKPQEKRLVFSVANGVGDGTLPGAKLEEMKTRSIAFIIWSGIDKAVSGYDSLINTAKDFQENIGGKMFTSTKEAWSDQTTTVMRENVRSKSAEIKQQKARKKV